MQIKPQIIPFSGFSPLFHPYAAQFCLLIIPIGDIIPSEMQNGYRRKTMSLLREKKLFIFDLDGTLYLGNQVLPGARELIKGLRAAGKSVCFYTNNSTNARTLG